MKFGFRSPSLKKSIAARISLKRAIRSHVRAPRGYGWITHPKKAAYNQVYRRTTRSCSSCLTMVIFVLLVVTLILWVL